MSVTERKLQHDLSLAEYYYQNRNTDITFKEKSIDLIKKCYEYFKSKLGQSMREVSSENIVQLAEIAFTVSLPEIASDLIDTYFELDNSSTLSKNSFYVRALLVKAKVDAQIVKLQNLKAEDAANALLTSIKSIQKGIEIIAKPENKQKYASILYNASIITIDILKDYLKINWSKNYWEILEKISAMLEENDDVDFNWRILILIKLAQSYIDADKKPEGAKALDKITDILKKKGDCDFMDELYRIRIHLSRDNSGALGNLKKEGETNAKFPQFKYLYTVQAIKSGIIQEKDIDKEVNGVITAVCPDFLKNIDPTTNKFKSAVSIKLDAWKADVLAEIAYAILGFNSMLNIAYNLYSFLMQNGSNSLKGKIYLENMRAMKVLHDLEDNLKQNPFPKDIIRQKRIDSRTEALQILERNMAGCARLQEYNLINETSFIIFNTAIPFFKKSFRKNFFKAFNTSCDQLEQICSNENYLRAAMHYELSKYYLEEDLLQEANTNLIKALTNDYSIPINKLGGNANAASKGKNAKEQKDDNVNLTNSTSNNVSYLQRNLEQYLVYLKRNIGVKVNLYTDPENTIDQLIFECDNIKNSKNPKVKEETISKCTEMIQAFAFDEFKLPESERDFVEEEINTMKTKHDLKIYDDKKHFILISGEICKYCYENEKYDNVFKIDEVISKFTEELNPQRDVDQYIALSETKMCCAKCYIEYLLQNHIEPCGNSYSNFEDPSKQYSEEETTKFDEWRKGIFASIKEAMRLAVLVNQHWLIFTIANELWNTLLPLIRGPQFNTLCNEDLIPVFNDIFEALNTSMAYYESIGAEIINTDYFANVDTFVNFAAIYGKFMEFKQKQEECIKICDMMLGRKLESKYRKIFDMLKARAMFQGADSGGNKKKAPAKPPVSNKKDNTGGSFVPSQDMNLLSDCFANVENAINTEDEKAKVDLLKKGVDMLKTYKINFNDESTLELSSELWYKYGVQFYSVRNNECFKYATLCADNCVSTYDNIDIAKEKKKNISITLQKWYCLGFLLYGDCLVALVDKDKQERLSQINLYFKAIDKLVTSAKIAEKAKQYLVILQDIKAFYSIVINIVEESQNREKLCKYFTLFHQILINNKNGAQILYSDPEFLLLFFSIYCICINELQNWELGEKIINEGIKIIPSQFQHILLEHKLFYYSKQGKSFLQNLNVGAKGGSGDKDVLAKAKLFTKLARSSTNKSDQFTAYTKAIELLKSDQNIYVCNVIFELSSWLYKNNYPYSDIEENLNQGADILLEIDTLFEDEEDLEDEGQTLHSKRSSSTRRSRLSKRSKSKRSGVTQSKRRSSVSGTKSKASEKSKSRNYSSHTSKTKSIFAKMLDYDPYPLYMNINHYEYLFKIQVFLSMVAIEYLKKQEYLLDAFFVLRKILEISMKTLNCIEFYEKNKDEIEQNNYTGQDINPLMSLVNHYYIAKDINIPQVYTIPDNLDAWLTYEWPESFVKRIEIENDNNANQSAQIASANVSLPNYTFFCQKSFEAPYQFFYYFNYMLDKFMNEFYYHSECLMMIKFGMLYSKYILKNSDMEYAFSIKFSRLVNNIVLQLNDNQTSLSIYNNIKTLLENQPKLTADIINDKRNELRKYDLNLNANKEEYFKPNGIYNPDNVIEYIDDIKTHVSWIELAQEYYFSGFYNYSKEYSKEAQFHSLIMKDKDNFIKTNLLLANIAFIEGAFDESSRLYSKIQSINQSPSMMFTVIRKMSSIFDYMRKYEEMNIFLNTVLDYFESEYKKIENKESYYPPLTLFYQMYTYSIINKARVLVMRYSENIKQNEYNIIKEQRMKINVVLSFYKDEIFPLLKQFNDLTAKSSLNIYNIQSLFDFISLTLVCLTKNNLFVYVNKDELGVICTIFENCLHILEDISGYLNRLQTYIPLRIDNSIIYLPVHRLMAYAKIIYAVINNIIGEFKNRIKREGNKKQKLSMNDKDISAKFAEGVKYNQEVIDYLNSLTKKINKMKVHDEQDNLDNMNRYEKSISLLVSCESLIPSMSKEYIEYYIEKIHSFRLQAIHFKELKHIWDKATLDEINLLKSPIEEQANETQTSKDNKKSKFEIHKFHQLTINYISDFEKNIIQNNDYEYLLRTTSTELLKYYIAVIETSGYLNIELSFKALADYQNTYIKSYYNEIIERYMNQQSRDWSTFAFYNQCKKDFSFESQSHSIYSSVSTPESLYNYEKYIDDIPYYKTANGSYYQSWNEVKTLLPNNSAYFIFQMDQYKSILYIGLMTITTSERKVNYFIKRIILNQTCNSKFDDMIQTIKAIKHNLIKTVILTKEDLDKFFTEQDSKISKVVDELENFNELKEVFVEINDIINPNLDIPEQQEKEKEDPKAKQNKKPQPAPKKEKSSIQTDIPLPTSNIEQITFLIDHRFADIPFESMSLFSKIPFKSNDFCLNTNIMRLKSVNFTSTAPFVSLPGNVKYYLDYSKDQNIKIDIKNSVTSHLSSSGGGGKNNPSSPIEGIVSNEHKSSIAEFQKLYMASNIFIFTSQTALLYQFPYEIFDTSRYAKCKIGIIIDRIATTKNFVDQASLIPKTFSFNYQPIDTIAMMTLAGVCSVITTKWSINYDEVSELLDDMLEEGTAKGMCLSYAINKYKTPKRVPIAKEGEEEVQAQVKPPSGKGKQPQQVKKKEEVVVLDDTNSVEVKKMNIFTLAPIVFGLNNVKIV